MRKNKIKILYLIDSLGCGGAEKRLINDAVSLDKTLFHCEICYIYNKNDFENILNYHGVRSYCLQENSQASILNTLIKLKKIIKSSNPDILHIHLFKSSIYGRFISLFFGKLKVVSTIHSMPSLHSYKMKILDSITGRLLNDRFIAVTDFIKERAQEEFRFKNIEVIPNYINNDFISSINDNYKKDEYELFNEYRDYKKIVNVANLSFPKGQKYLIEAISDVIKSRKDVRLLIAGVGPLENELKALAKKLKIEDYVIFLGKVNNVRLLLESSDIFILTSISEGSPISLMEAMTAGKPCIVSRIGALEETLTDGVTGFFAIPRDKNDIARVILDVLNDPLKARRVGDNSKKAISGKDIHKNSVKKLEMLYKNLKWHY